MAAPLSFVARDQLTVASGANKLITDSTTIWTAANRTRIVMCRIQILSNPIYWSMGGTPSSTVGEEGLVYGELEVWGEADIINWRARAQSADAEIEISAFGTGG